MTSLSGRRKNIYRGEKRLVKGNLCIDSRHYHAVRQRWRAIASMIESDELLQKQVKQTTESKKNVFSLLALDAHPFTWTRDTFHLNKKTTHSIECEH